MARPILRLAMRVTRRTRWTAWAIAFGCMVLVGSLTLIDGIAIGVDTLASRVQAGPSVYLHGDDLLVSAIDASDLPLLPGNFTAVRVHVGQFQINGGSWDVVVAAVTSYVEGSPDDGYPPGTQNISVDVGLRSEIVSATGRPLDATADLTLFGVRAAGLAVFPPPPSRPNLFPNHWVWASAELFVSMDAQQERSVQAIVTSSPLDPSLVTQLGLSPLPPVGAVGFAQGVVSEARAGLLGLGLVIAIVIGLLVYSAMAIEVRTRSAEIQILRGLGTPPSTVAAVYEGQAILMAVLGATVGSSLGLVIANAVVSFTPVVGLPNLVVVQPSLALLGLVYGLVLLASAVGGLGPARVAVRALRGGPEAGPS